MGFHDFSTSHLPGTFERNHVTGQWRWSWSSAAWQPAPPTAGAPAPGGDGCGSSGGLAAPGPGHGKGDHFAELELEEAKKLGHMRRQMEQGAEWAKEIEEEEEEKKRKQTQGQTPLLMATTKAKGMPPVTGPPPGDL